MNEMSFVVSDATTSAAMAAADSGAAQLAAFRAASKGARSKMNRL